MAACSAYPSAVASLEPVTPLGLAFNNDQSSLGELAAEASAEDFMVNHAGAVYQKNLGPRTDELAKRITSFDPDKSWEKVVVESPMR